MNGVGITVVDTPGLADGSGNEEVYLQRVKEEVTGFDVFIFCTEMNTHRIRNDDIKTIEKLAEAFGPELWKHAVVALTFANEVHPPPSKRDVMEQEFFDDYLRKFKGKIQQVLLDVGVPEETMIKVPFVPTGDLCEPQLPGIENWIVCFWIATFKRLNRSAQPTFLLANINRFNYDSGRGGSVSPGISPPRPDQNAEINSDCRVLNRSQSMNEGKQRTPQETLPKPKPKAKSSRNEQGPDTDTPVGIDLDEASAGEIMMEILDEVGKEESKMRGDFIRPGTGNLLPIIFKWLMNFFKKWLLRKPSTTNEAVEEEESEKQEGN